MPDVNGPVCMNHQDTPATHFCACCGKPVCDDCTISECGSFYCSDKCRAKGFEAALRSNSVINSANKSNIGAVIGKIIAVIIIIAIGIAAYYFYTQNKESIDSKVSSVSSSIDKGLSDAKKSVDDSLDMKTQHKKDLEESLNK